MIDGIPAGEELVIGYIRSAMDRWAPNKSVSSTKRGETDDFEILGGVVDGVATGAPLAVIIRNNDTRPSDYGDIFDMPRPGHADYTGYMKFKGANDVRGGGHFSGRLTAPIVFSGSIARMLLERKGIFIGAHIKRINIIEDPPFSKYTKEEVISPETKAFPVLNEKIGKNMQTVISSAAKDGDSVGGIIECAAIGLPVGMGEPFFDSVESEMAHVLFSIPAVKGVEFGMGFGFAGAKGSDANDPLFIDGNGDISFKSNNNGGINGGITNGMPVVVNVVVKPTPSISKAQDTVSLGKKENMSLRIKEGMTPV